MSGSRRALVVALVAVVVAVVAGGGFGLAGLFHHGGSSSTPRALPPAQTEDVDASDAPSVAPSGGAGSVGSAEYGLTAKGLTGFLATYATRFGTPRTVQLVLYPDYAVVEVPVRGGQGRQAGWLYRPATGWTSFGGVTAVFPGSSTVDTRQIDVAALVRNLARARTGLKVEHPSQTYVIVRYITTFDTAPSIDVYVANGFNESGYLATRLDGSVERAYPFSR